MHSIYTFHFACNSFSCARVSASGVYLYKHNTRLTDILQNEKHFFPYLPASHSPSSAILCANNSHPCCDLQYPVKVNIQIATKKT